MCSTAATFGFLRRSRAFGFALAAFGVAAPATLHAAAVLTNDNLRTETSVFWYDNPVLLPWQRL